MKCPVCNNKLHKQSVDDINVCVCQGGCGGIWFDNRELSHFDEPHESAGNALLDIETNPSTTVNHDTKRPCPTCDNIIMMRHFFSTEHQVEIDECGNCGGIWLDSGELSHIRNLFDSEEEKKAAAKKYFSDIFGKELSQMKAESNASLKKAQTFANMFKFICPSYYIPNDQDWGAF